MRRIREAAQARGLPGFQVEVLVTNKPMLDVFHESGLTVRTRLEGQRYHVELLFPEGDVSAPAGRPGETSPGRPDRLQ